MNYQFYINDFEGPLDLLLHLVKQSKMDIYEINLHDLINQYLKYINDMENLNIDIASEYLVMAAELVHLKSKMLIHKEDEEDDTESEFGIQTEEDLRQKILEYDKIKELTSSFKELEEKRNEVYTKLPENLKEYYEEAKLPKGLVDVEDLVKAILAFQDRKKQEAPLHTKITKKEISVEDRTKEIKNILKNQKRIDFFSLFEIPRREYIVVTFLSILTMSKNKEVVITQESNFSPIVIEGVENE